MEHVLYADILFFINFSMDFITLYLTSRLTSGPPPGWRTVLSALIGGVWGTVAVAVGIGGIGGIVLGGAVSVIMVLISFGFGGASLLLRRSAIFWGSAALLGGVMTALFSFSDSVETPGSSAGGTALLFLGSTLCLLLVRLISAFTKKKSVSITVSVNGRSAVFDALVDSGNIVTDPLSGRSVIIADRSVLLHAIPDLPSREGEIPSSLTEKIRMIPVRGIGGSGVLIGFIPDRVEVTGSRRRHVCDAVIAVSFTGSQFFGGFPANVPATLI